MSKLPAHSATAKDSSTGSRERLPVTPIQAADGAIASAQPRSRFAAHVNRFEYGYNTRYAAATGARMSASVFSCHAANRNTPNDATASPAISGALRRPRGR